MSEEFHTEVWMKVGQETGKACKRANLEERYSNCKLNWFWMTKSLVSVSSDKTGRRFVIFRDGPTVPDASSFILNCYLKQDWTPEIAILIIEDQDSFRIETNNIVVARQTLLTELLDWLCAIDAPENVQIISARNKVQ